jgi:ParB/RepB/Spo0J family partition protein
MKTNSKLYAAVGEIVRNEEQPRTYFDPEALSLLGGSLAQKQRQPITVVPHSDPEMPEVRWKIVDGERRWRAAQEVGLETVWIVIDDDVRDETDMHTASFVANWNRAGHTHAETAAGIEREMKAGKTVGEIARLVGRSESWVSAEHSLLKLHPDLMRQIDPPTPRAGRIPMKVAYALVQWRPEKQVKLWKQLKGKVVSDVFHHLRTSAPSQAVNRRAGDDALYLLHRMRAATRTVGSLMTLPDVMVKGLTDGQRRKIIEQIQTLKGKADEALMMLDVGLSGGGEV